MTNGDSIGSTLETLRLTQKKLLMIDESQLDSDARIKLADNLDDCSSNIMKLEAADLANLNEEFKRNEPEMIQASTKLQSDLETLNKSIEVVNAVSSALEVISKGVALLV